MHQAFQNSLPVVHCVILIQVNMSTIHIDKLKTSLHLSDAATILFALIANYNSEWCLKSILHYTSMHVMPDRLVCLGFIDIHIKSFMKQE